MGTMKHGRRPWLVAGILLVVMAMFAAACGDDATTTTAAGSTTQATTARSLTIALAEEPRTLASWNAYSNDGHPVLRNVTEALLNRDPVTNELVPELATSYEQVDPNTWRFHLRQGVTFHDGSAFNAEAAAYSLNYVLDVDNAFPMLQFFGGIVATATAVDELTLDVATDIPDPILPLRLYFTTIPSAKQLQEDPARYEDTPIGTGPYKFDEWNRGQFIDISANADWWGLRDTADAHGTNQLVSDVHFVFRPETEVRAGMLATGEADFARFITPEQCEAAPQCESTPTVETIIVRIDTPNPVLADVRVREAIALAIDKESIMNDILGGGEVANQIVSSSALGWNSSLEPYPYDPTRAAELIAEAAADGVDVTAPFTFAARTGFILRADEIIQFISVALNTAGMTGVTPQMMETAQFEELWSDMGYANVSPDRAFIGMNQHGNEMMDYAGSVGNYFMCEGGASAYCDPAFDEMAKTAFQQTGDARDQALQDLAAYTYDTYPIIPIGYPLFNFGLVDGINWTPRMDGFILIKEFTFSS